MVGRAGPHRRRSVTGNASGDLGDVKALKVALRVSQCHQLLDGQSIHSQFLEELCWKPIHPAICGQGSQLVRQPGHLIAKGSLIRAPRPEGR